MRTMGTSSWRKGLASFMASLVVFTVSPVWAQDAGVVTTPIVPLELPVEVELELAPGSLKQAPLWHEVAEILEDPYNYDCPDPAKPNECFAGTPRRPSFLPAGCSYQPNLPPGIPPCDDGLMPPLSTWSPHWNLLTDQPLRLGISGEINWDQPGPLFGEDDGDPATPITEIIGYLVVDDAYNLVVANPGPLVGSGGIPHPDLPEDGFIVGTPAFNDEGEIIDEDGEEVVEFETPITELDFLRPSDDLAGIPSPQRPYIGRRGAQALGKALFWDMQVGSDGVQACGSCHFHAGTDNRTKNQMNPNSLGGDQNFEVRQPNETLVASDFPFHKLANTNIPGEPLMNPGNVVSDSNDVMSSMGVRFRKFRNIRQIGLASFGPPSNPLYPGVRPLLPDLESLTPTDNIDPLAGFQGTDGSGHEFRRVEPRNTPTIFGVAFNFDNFWDGRARHDANGGSVFGPADPQFHVFIDPGAPNAGGGNLQGATNGHFREAAEIPTMADQPVRIRFSSLASLATGPALSDAEMSFAGRNWQKLGKKLLQVSVTPLANQLVDPWDSVLGPFSNQRQIVNGPINRPGRPGLNVSYEQLIRLAFDRHFWHNSGRHLRGVDAVCTGPAVNGVLDPPDCDPFDGFKLANVGGAADPENRNQFTQMEANMSLFFGLSLQIWQELLTPDNTPLDRFFDMNPLAGNGVAQPGELNTLQPDQVRELVTGSPTGQLNLPEGFGEEELFGFDIFAGANLTAALPLGSARNPEGNGSNPFHRTARCMICHIGPEQTDHTNNVNAGLLLGSTEYELPAPEDPEPTGPFRLVTGIPLAEEVEENAQDGVEVENRNFVLMDEPSTSYDEGQIGSPTAIAFQDNGVYNIGVRPTSEDIMRGGNDAFGWPLSLAAMAMKNLGGEEYEPCDDTGDWNTHPDDCAITHVVVGGAGPNGLFEETGADQRVNPGLEMEPGDPELPPYLAPWANNLPAGEANPLIDELGFAPNTVLSNVDPNFGPTAFGPPFAEFDEIMFGSDYNCGLYDPAQFGNEAPNFGWGPQTPGIGGCPNAQSAIPVNSHAPRNGTYPFPNRVARMGAVKAPQLRNVELTGPYFHTGSFLTLRQVVDFYMRGGDFPITNGEDRDPNLVNMSVQAFGFGTTIGLPPEFMDGVPDLISQYGFFPDTGTVPFPDGTFVTEPEPPNATPEEAKVALVKFLLALTDQRVAREMAPFDHPEVFIPLDGRAPDNTFGREGFLVASDPLIPCLGVGTTPCFKHVPAVGAAGNAAPLTNFLEISSIPIPGDNNDHFDR